MSTQEVAGVMHSFAEGLVLDSCHCLKEVLSAPVSFADGPARQALARYSSSQERKEEVEAELVPKTTALQVL